MPKLYFLHYAPPYNAGETATFADGDARGAGFLKTGAAREWHPEDDEAETAAQAGDEASKPAPKAAKAKPAPKAAKAKPAPAAETDAPAPAGEA
jgi:hypothetical protein